MKHKFYILFFVSLVSFAFYNIQNFPAHFPKPKYDFSKNSLDSSKVELGKTLFYDPVLSRNNTISCASCHSPFSAFAHTDHDLSHGINDEIGTRNAPALFNLAWQSTFMWDGAVNHLDVQALAPITHPKEMGNTIVDVVNTLNKSSQYKKLFFHAFGDSLATGERLLKALSQFQLTLVSANSKYDKMKQGTISFSEQEQKGYVLFQNYCNACHTEPLFSNYGFANNGLALDTTLNDFGKWNVTKQSKDSLLFKIPSLRNLSFTFPYMHDGRFKKLSEVLNHYTNGISYSTTLSEEVKKPIKLSSNDKTDLIAFLLTLNDTNFVFNSQHRFQGKR